MSTLSKLKKLEKLSLTRFSYDFYIGRIRRITNIFPSIDNEHRYAYVETIKKKHRLNIGRVFPTQLDNGCFFDTPDTIIEITRAEHNEIRKWLNKADKVFDNSELVEFLETNII